MLGSPILNLRLKNSMERNFLMEKEGKGVDAKGLYKILHRKLAESGSISDEDLEEMDLEAASTNQSYFVDNVMYNVWMR